LSGIWGIVVYIGVQALGHLLEAAVKMMKMMKNRFQVLQVILSKQVLVVSFTLKY
jgi:hypothetical protein